MDTTAINSTNATTNGGISSSTPTTKSFKDMKSEDFFALLIAQLQNQDPLKPTDNQQLLQQMSTIQQMQQSVTLNKTLGDLAHEQRFGATSGMIGQYVTGTLTDSVGNSANVSGLVVGVHFDKDGAAQLELHNGKTLPAANVNDVTLVSNLPPDVQAQLAAELAQRYGSGSTPSGSGNPIGATPTAPSGGNGTGNTQRVRSTDRTSADLLARLSNSADQAASAISTLLSPKIGFGF